MQVRSEDITTILDVCLERMQRGDSPEACLLDYPSEAEELAPLLFAAMHVRAFNPPRLAPQARQAIQRQLRQAVAERQPAPRRAVASWFKPAIVRFALALVIAIVGMGRGVAAAQASLPGSPLYPLKRAGEHVRLTFGFSPSQRAALHLDFAAARSAEIQELANRGQSIDSQLVADLEREFSLAREEFGRAPSADASYLAIRYVAERQANIAIFSALLIRGEAVGRPQLERALQLNQQALVGVGPARAPMQSTPEPAPDYNTNVRSTPVPNTGLDPQSTPVGNDQQTGANHGGQGHPVVPQATPNTKPTPAGTGRPPETPPGQDNGKPPETPPGQDNGKPPETPPGQDNGKPADAGTGQPANTGAGQLPETPPGQDNGKPSDAGAGQPPEAPPGQNGKPADAGAGQQSSETPPSQSSENKPGRSGRP